MPSSHPPKLLIYVQVQAGLSSIHTARVKIESILSSAPEAMETEQMISLVNSVQRNIADIISILEEAERQGGRTDISPAANKKLRNDILKEEVPNAHTYISICMSSLILGTAL